jgi:hypothetical protein
MGRGNRLARSVHVSGLIAMDIFVAGYSLVKERVWRVFHPLFEPIRDLYVKRNQAHFEIKTG